MKVTMKRGGRRLSMPHNTMTVSKPETPTDEAADDADTSLPQTFAVKYLGKCDAAGLWGIKHTRKPVDKMVTEARNATKSGAVTLPYLKLVVSEEGVDIAAMPQNQNSNYEPGAIPIHTISYGVQDLVYTRVFAMITVQNDGRGQQPVPTEVAVDEQQRQHPFQCHVFVCDSRSTARRLTFSLANAFKIFSQSVKAQEIMNRPKKFAIDLRGSEESSQDDLENTADDSEV